MLKATLTEELVLRYDVEARLEVKSGGEPESVEQHLRLRFTVAHADKEVALVRCQVESAKVRAKSPGKEAVEFAWQEGDGPGAEDEPVLAQLYRRVGGAMVELNLDGHGAVKSVSGLDRIATEASEARLLGVLAPEAAGRMLQSIFTMDPDGRAHGAGQSWSFAQEVPAGVWMTTASTEYTLKELAGDVARVTGRTTITPHELKGSEADIKPRLEIPSQSVKADAEWDTHQGQLIRRTTEGTVVMKSTLPLKQPIGATTTSTSRIVFTRVAEGADPAK